ncbi:LOW QUALITY PROTEIN: prolactin-inducible protein [Dugong dugon]
MCVLLLPSRAGPAALLLVLCLQLGASNAQENNFLLSKRHFLTLTPGEVWQIFEFQQYLGRPGGTHWGPEAQSVSSRVHVPPMPKPEDKCEDHSPQPNGDPGIPGHRKLCEGSGSREVGASKTRQGSNDHALLLSPLTSWKVMTMDLQMQQTAKKNEEVPVTLKLSTEVQECMVVKTYLKSSRPLEGTSHNYDFMSCLCNDYPGTFFWDIRSNYTVKIAAVDIIRQLNICPEDRAVVPIKANHFYTFQTLQITS